MLCRDKLNTNNIKGGKAEEILEDNYKIEKGSKPNY